MKAPALLGLLLILVVLINPAGTALSEEPPRPGRGAQAALGTAFVYQGFLKQSGNAVNGSCDFQFSLWDAAAAGAQVGSTVSSNSVSVGAGLFTAQLDFGAGAFDGQARWVETAVRCPAGAGEYTALSPRQALTPVPYALHAAVAGTAGGAPWSGLTGVPAGFADGVDNDSDHTGVYWSTTGNAGMSSANFLGTTDGMTLTLGVGGPGAGLRLEKDLFGGVNVIHGLISGGANGATSGVGGASIGGGERRAPSPPAAIA